MEADKLQELIAGKDRAFHCYTLSVVTYRCYIVGVVTNDCCYRWLLLQIVATHRCCYTSGVVTPRVDLPLHQQCCDQLCHVILNHHLLNIVAPKLEMWVLFHIIAVGNRIVYFLGNTTQAVVTNVYLLSSRLQLLYFWINMRIEDSHH